MYTDDMNAYRRAFYTAWQKYLAKQPLERLEAELVEVIALHPEYQRFLTAADIEKQEFALEENPFFHLSLHLAIAEQLRSDRPAGIQAIYQNLLTHQPDQHAVLHQMMQCLAQALWQAQQTGTAPDEQTYLNALREHCK
jgi:hypothetical protein